MDWREKVKTLKADAVSWNEIADIIQAEYFPADKWGTVKERCRHVIRRAEKTSGPKLNYGGNDKFIYAFDNITLYPIGDVHIGAWGFNEKAFRRYIKEIEQDDTGRVILLGDMIDNATLDSKGNVFSQRMTPQQQKEKAIELLYPIKDKILYVASGNHCERTYKQTGCDIMYDICMGLGILDRYHPVAGYIRIKTGSQTYNIYATHNLGKSEAKLKQMAKSFTGIDLLLAGHIHTPKNITAPQKLFGGEQKDIKLLIVAAWLTDENYAVSAAYEPVSMQQSKVRFGRDRHRVEVIS